MNDDGTIGDAGRDKAGRGFSALFAAGAVLLGLAFAWAGTRRPAGLDDFEAALDRLAEDHEVLKLEVHSIQAQLNEINGLRTPEGPPR
jgi:hypothetical protein